MTSSISSFEIINVVRFAKSEERKRSYTLATRVNIPRRAPYPETFMYSCAYCWCCYCDPNGIKTLLAYGFSIFFIEGKPDFNNGWRSPLKNSSNYTILNNRIFDNFILADYLFVKAFQSLVSVNDNLCGKLVSSVESPTTFDEIFKTT